MQCVRAEMGSLFHFLLSLFLVNEFLFSEGNAETSFVVLIPRCFFFFVIVLFYLDNCKELHKV